MKVSVKFFGMIAEVAKVKEIELNDVADTNSLMQLLLTRYAGISQSNYAVAVNKKLISGNMQLKNNDEIALLPPFAGG